MENLSEKEQKTVKAAKFLSKFFSIDLTIKILGVEIISYHFPPKV